MRKWIITLAVLIALLGGGSAYLWWGPPKLRLVAAGDITAAFASDLHDFVLQNAGRLPSDWGEFERWEVKASGRIRWSAAATSKRLRILSEPYAVVDGAPRFIEVIDFDIKGMESHINQRIEQARLALTQTNNTVNQGSERTGAPLRASRSSATDSVFNGAIRHGNIIYSRQREFPSLPEGMVLHDQSAIGWPRDTLLRIQSNGVFAVSGARISATLPPIVASLFSSWTLTDTRDLQPVPGPYAAKEMRFGTDWRVIQYWSWTNLVETNNFVVWYDMDWGVYKISISPAKIELWETPVLESVMVEALGSCLNIQQMD